MRLSDAGLALIAESEGFVGHLYDDAAGHATIGYGHLVHHGPTTAKDREAWPNGITKEAAAALLREDAAKAEGAVNRLVKVALTQGQFDALVDFVFNVGEGAFEKSTLRAMLNAGKPKAEVASQFARWSKAGGKVLQGLVTRRGKEREMFLGA